MEGWSSIYLRVSGGGGLIGRPGGGEFVTPRKMEEVSGVFVRPMGGRRRGGV